MARKTIDCREYPTEGVDCSMTMSGEEDELLRAATEHAVSVHGEKRSEELESNIKEMMTDEVEVRAPRPPAEEQPLH